MNTNDMIFVFGSNSAGIHGAGAAKYAAKYKGAKYGIGFGHQGASFAIPTKDSRLNTWPLTVIREYVDRFIHYAQQNPEMKFQVTCIGCGLAGLKHEDIAPMFSQHPPNCYFDLLWANYLPAGSRYWGTF